MGDNNFNLIKDIDKPFSDSSTTLSLINRFRAAQPNNMKSPNRLEKALLVDQFI